MCLLPVISSYSTLLNQENCQGLLRAYHKAMELDFWCSFKETSRAVIQGHNLERLLQLNTLEITLMLWALLTAVVSFYSESNKTFMGVKLNVTWRMCHLLFNI